MPVSRTKNAKSQKELEIITKKAFPNSSVKHIIELSDGYFNAAYRVILSNLQEFILKIAPPQDIPVMTHEINIMHSEVEVMQLVGKHTSVPLAKVVFYDNSLSVCDSEYFFMESLHGDSFSSKLEDLDEKQRNHVYFQIGKHTSSINSIQNSLFGYYGQPQKQGREWFCVFKDMVMDAYADAEKLQIPVAYHKDKLLSALDRDRACFKEVKHPSLVHWDIWAGNTFVDGDNVVGIIDFERSLWADPLMEVGFRTYQCKQAFLDGYGRPSLSDAEKRRAYWYDVYLFLISILESDYRNYETRNTFLWGSERLKQWMEEKITN